MPDLPVELVEVLDALPDGHALYLGERDAAGQVVALRGIYMNPAGLALRGTDLCRFVGSDLLERTRRLGNHAVADGYVAALNAGEQMHRTIVTDDLSGPRTFELTAKCLVLGGQEMLSMSFRDVTQELHSRRRMQRAVEISAANSRTDELTGLLNRRGWQAAIERACSSDQGCLSVAIADLDHFKSYNDAHGHPAGDQLLRDLARTWTQLLTAPRALARIGGEEFAILLPGLPAKAAAASLEGLAEVVPAGQTASIGVAARRGAESPSQLLGRADAALYVAKRGGRARVVIAP